ncbi:unnamed protein product [Schistosoma intercalatum]|nr:unnamed protein product [Schistosoma intercalatum]
MADYDGGVLAVGINVDIQRTDGRVHSAIVSGINPNTKSVTVEWYEKGEAKGKEIELEAILQLNPNLRYSCPIVDNVYGNADISRNNLVKEVPNSSHRPGVNLPTDIRQSQNSVPVAASASVLAPSSNKVNATQIEYSSSNQPRLIAPSTRVPVPSSRVPIGHVPTRSTTISAYDDRTNNSSRSQAPLPVHNSVDISHTHNEGFRYNVHQHRAISDEPMDEDLEPSESVQLDLNDYNHVTSMLREPENNTLLTERMEQDIGDVIEDNLQSGIINGNRGFAGDASRRLIGRANSNLGAPIVNSTLSALNASSPTTAPGVNAGAAGGSGTLRKSNCVKVIERIQQRREERRAAQKAVRDQIDLDPTNPSYEFHMMIHEYRNTLEYRPLTNTDLIEDHQIGVCVRKRPMNKKELGRREIDVITVPNKQHVLVHEPKTKVDLTKYLENQQFRFDYAFDDTSDNELVYRYTAKPLVECIFQRGMATCFAYGQTGSGKTHTMGGEFHARGQQNCSNGIYALAAADVFDLNTTTYRNENLRIVATFFEIYSGKVFDLLNKKAKLRVLEDAKGQVQIVGLREEEVNSVDCVLKPLQHGAHIRTSGQTSANQHSSRSHAVFQLILKKQSTGKIHGKFSLIDLAGNERGVDTSAEINKSLLALKECIRALGRRGAHLPFRASKLTQADRVKELGPGTLSASNSNTDLPANGNTNQPQLSSRSSNCTVAGGTVPPQINFRNPPSTNIGTSGNILSKNYYPSSNNNDFSNNNWQNDTLTNNHVNSIAGGDGDLAMLRSANEGEVPEEVLHFHEVIDQIERMEEEICDDHKAVCHSMSDWTKEHYSLYKISNQVEFDVEEYSARLEYLLSKEIKILSSLKDKVTLWRRDRRQEEELSTNSQRNLQ